MFCNVAKDFLDNSVFWTEMKALLPTAKDGLTVRTPVSVGNAIVAQPCQDFLDLWWQLALQTMLWTPSVEYWQVICRHLHRLCHAISLSKSRFLGVFHYGLDYEECLWQHDNLVGVCSEGLSIATRRSARRSPHALGQNVLTACLNA